MQLIRERIESGITKLEDSSNPNGLVSDLNDFAGWYSI